MPPYAPVYGISIWTYTILSSCYASAMNDILICSYLLQVPIVLLSKKFLLRIYTIWTGASGSTIIDVMLE